MEISALQQFLVLAETLNFTQAAEKCFVTQPTLSRKIAVLENETAGKVMEVYTDLPGVQFYAGNFLKPERGKAGKTYDFRSGLALETQYYPDTPNKPQFPSSVFGPERHYHTVTEYRFV